MTSVILLILQTKAMSGIYLSEFVSLTYTERDAGFKVDGPTKI